MKHVSNMLKNLDSTVSQAHRVALDIFADTYTSATQNGLSHGDACSDAVAYSSHMMDTQEDAAEQLAFIQKLGRRTLQAG